MKDSQFKLTALHGGTMVINRIDNDDKYERAQQIREESSNNSIIRK